MKHGGGGARHLSGRNVAVLQLMPDGNRLPYANGETYQEWDTEPCVVGAGRGADRIVTCSTGKVYYSNDHYANFTEFTP